MEFRPEGVMFNYEKEKDKKHMETLSTAWAHAASEEDKSAAEQVTGSQLDFVDVAEAIGRMHAAYALANVELSEETILAGLKKHEKKVFLGIGAEYVHWANRLDSATDGMYDPGMKFFVLRNDEVAQATDILDEFGRLPGGVLRGAPKPTRWSYTMEQQESAQKLSKLICSNQVAV